MQQNVCGDALRNDWIPESRLEERWVGEAACGLGEMRCDLQQRLWADCDVQQEKGFAGMIEGHVILGGF